jgi:hypothetical protein
MQAEKNLAAKIHTRQQRDADFYQGEQLFIPAWDPTIGASPILCEIWARRVAWCVQFYFMKYRDCLEDREYKIELIRSTWKLNRRILFVEMETLRNSDGTTFADILD